MHIFPIHLRLCVLENVSGLAKRAGRTSKDAFYQAGFSLRSLRSP